MKEEKKEFLFYLMLILASQFMGYVIGKGWF